LCDTKVLGQYRVQATFPGSQKYLPQSSPWESFTIATSTATRRLSLLGAAFSL
jgi:hypothetical protein